MSPRWIKATTIFDEEIWIDMSDVGAITVIQAFIGHKTILATRRFGEIEVKEAPSHFLEHAVKT